MQFRLTILIDENLTRKDLTLNLKRIAATIERVDPVGTFEEGDGAPIRDIDGQKVGTWEIIP